MLDHAVYPHIVDTILAASCHAVLVKWRATSRAFRTKADARLFAHVVLNPRTTYIGLLSPLGLCLPVLPELLMPAPDDSMDEQARDLLSCTAVIDVLKPPATASRWWSRNLVDAPVLHAADSGRRSESRPTVTFRFIKYSESTAVVGMSILEMPGHAHDYVRDFFTSSDSRLGWDDDLPPPGLPPKRNIVVLSDPTCALPDQRCFDLRWPCDGDKDHRVEYVLHFGPAPSNPPNRSSTPPVAGASKTPLGILDDLAFGVHMQCAESFRLVGMESLPACAFGVPGTTLPGTWNQRRDALRALIIKRAREIGPFGELSELECDAISNSLSIMTSAEYREQFGDERFTLETVPPVIPESAALGPTFTH